MSCTHIQPGTFDFKPSSPDIEIALAVLAPTRLVWHHEQAGIIPDSCPATATAPSNDGHHVSYLRGVGLSTWQVRYKMLKTQDAYCIQQELRWGQKSAVREILLESSGFFDVTSENKDNRIKVADDLQCCSFYTSQTSAINGERAMAVNKRTLITYCHEENFRLK